MASISENLNLKKSPINQNGIFTQHAKDYVKKIKDSGPSNVDKYESDFDNFQQGVVGALKDNKLNNLAKTLANREWANFFKVYEAGFALEQQWSEMEA